MSLTRTTELDHTILEAALIGLEQKLQRLDGQIAEIRRMLDKGDPAKRRRKWRISEAARKRIVAAQRKRWAEYRKARGR